MTSIAPEVSGETRILIVDDSRAIQAIVRRVIERIGYPALQLQVASNGEQALRAVDDFRPHLVLSDWHMPEMSGLEMFQMLRQNGHGQLKVGFITTETTPTLLDEARRNGAAFILNKPFRDSDLVSEVTQVLPVPAVEAVAPGETASADVPAATDAPARQLALIANDALQALIKRNMGEIPFRLIDHDGLALHELTDQNMLAVYSAQGRPLAAVAVLDTRAVCIIGGGAAGLMPAAVRPAIASGQPTARMVELSSRFLQEAGRLMKGVSPQGLVLGKVSMVPQSLPMLSELLSRSQWRVDRRISVPGYGEGRLSFLAV
jgi:CheY-like chemotaxis protein